MSAETSMRGLVAVAILVFVLAIIAVIVPSTGDDIQTTNPVAAGSEWDNNNVTTTGADIWSDNISTVSSAAGIVIVAVIIGVIMGLSSRKKD